MLGNPLVVTRGQVSLVFALSKDEFVTGEPVWLYWGPKLADSSALADWVKLQTRAVTHSAVDHSLAPGVLRDPALGVSGEPAVRLWRPGVTQSAGEQAAGEQAAGAQAAGAQASGEQAGNAVQTHAVQTHAAQTHAAQTHAAPASGAISASPRKWSAEVRDNDPQSSARVRLSGDDDEYGVRLVREIELTPSGLVVSTVQVTNIGASELVVLAAHNQFPVPWRAQEVLDVSGRWSGERAPQRAVLGQGQWRRSGRKGRPSHDGPLFVAAGSPGFGFSSGEVWATHLAWSGNYEVGVERTPAGEAFLSAGELAEPGEIVLGAGDVYTSPEAWGAYAPAGLDDASALFHREIRDQSLRTRGLRKVMANTWEAVYYDHRLDRLTELADRAAKVGIERFVLDDGWFLGRRSDQAGLGDWLVDPKVWPRGLGPLIEHVQQLGMDFGLWVEPEMINTDSEVARAHPEWILRGRQSLPPQWRHEQVLNLQHPDAFAYLDGQLRALLNGYDIAFLKWDHNRDLIDAGHAGVAAARGQTLAVYRLLDGLRRDFPELEIESCASGGGRVDAGILARTDRVWASDSIDALTRQQVQRYTSVVVPPELIGSHIGASPSHTTGRRHSLSFRAATALLFSFGVEWDLTAKSREELAELADWVALHKELRPILHEGRTVRPDQADPAFVVHGVVSPDQTRAWFVAACVAAAETQHPALLRFGGLDPARSYTLIERSPHRDAHSPHRRLGWSLDRPYVVSGELLMRAGIQLPTMAPESALVFELKAAD